jgi:hypothetical protein
MSAGYGGMKSRIGMPEYSKTRVMNNIIDMYVSKHTLACVAFRFKNYCPLKQPACLQVFSSYIQCVGTISRGGNRSFISLLASNVIECSQAV